ncbi:L-arabinose transport ATP-binding protein AraG OS=Streptomyces glaucescens OX=1907 GN=araG PE=4 SV=1 [Streptomyces glaucescens]
MAGPVLEMRSIVKTFPGVRALSDVTLTVRQGEVHAICGENGAGKSTFMKVLSGVHPHGTYEGEVLFEEELCRFKDIRASEQQGIVIIHQELARELYLSIAESIFLGNEHAKRGRIDWHETLRHATELLRRGGLDDHPDTRVADIGVGKQQLVEIAKALAKKVKLLILDEPTSALNDEDSGKLLDLILQLKEQGITSIIISHKLNEIRTVADSATILRDGRTIETLDVKAAETTEDRIISGMVGRDLEHRFPERTPHHPEEGTAPALEVRNWTVHHPIDQQRKVVDDVSLEVRRGEIVGIAGLMGAGRTRSPRTSRSGRHLRPARGRHRPQGRQGDPYQDRPRGGAALHRRRHQGPQALRPEPHRHHQPQHLAQRPRQGRPAGNRGRARGTPGRRGLPHVHEHQGADGLEPVGKLSGGNQQKVVLSKWIFAAS